MTNSIKYRRSLIIQLTILITTALSCGWIGVLADSMLSDEPTGNTLSMLTFIVTALLIAIILRIISHNWHDFGIKAHIKGTKIWYFTKIIIFPLVTVLVIDAKRLLLEVTMNKTTCPVRFVDKRGFIMETFPTLRTS